MHRNPETLTTVFSSGAKLLLLSWVWSFDTMRETQYLLCWPFHLTQQMHGTSRSPTGLASPRLKNQLTLPRDKSQLVLSSVEFQLALSSVRSQLTAFFQNHQESQSIASGHDVIHIPVPFSIWGFYYDICDCHILCVWACAPACALSRTVLSQTKPNDKI